MGSGKAAEVRFANKNESIEGKGQEKSRLEKETVDSGLRGFK